MQLVGNEYKLACLAWHIYIILNSAICYVQHDQILNHVELILMNGLVFVDWLTPISNRSEVIVIC
jgi:hypothetical protein